MFLGSLYHYLFKNIAHVRDICKFNSNCICVFVFLFLCICVFVYLHVRHLGILFLMSWYNFLWKNIALVGSICKFDQTVFVYLCVCVFVFVYLVPQDSYKTNLAKKIPVCFLQLFCLGALNGIKSVKSVFPLILLILNFLTKQLWQANLALMGCDMNWTTFWINYCKHPVFFAWMP